MPDSRRLASLIDDDDEGGGAADSGAEEDQDGGDGEDTETRVDPSDGNRYPLAAFIAEYGGTVEDPPKQWREAGAADSREQSVTWFYRYTPANELHMDLREGPGIDAPRVRARLYPGKVFEVSERKHDEETGVTFLRLADGRGWTFDIKPGVGPMSVELPGFRPRGKGKGKGREKGGKGERREWGGKGDGRQGGGKGRRTREESGSPLKRRGDRGGRERGGECEMRVDKTDGLAYSLDDFIVQYGGSYEDPPAEWAEAPYSHGRRGGGGSGQQVCSPADVCDGDPGAEKTGYVCTICGDDTARWGVWAPCGHHACWKCTLRVRFIFPDDSKARLCCICQQEAETVVITERPPPGLGERQDPDDAYDLAVFDFARTLRDHKWGIPCTEQASMRAVESLRRPFCPLWRECGARRAFHCMKDLDQHLWDQHSKAHCRVCREGSRNFLSELSLYTEVELEEHGRGKLAREMHFPGHPHCHFCRQDQYDDEALMAHLHHRHEVCVLCDRGSEARPILHFCRHVDALESHLRDKHILCPTCSEQYKAARRSGRVDRHPTEFAFRLEVDYRKHMMDVHGKSAGAVNVSELLGFTYGKGQQGGGKGGKKGAGHGGGDSGGEEEGLGATTVFFEFPGRQPKRVRMGGTPTVPAARSAGSPAAAGQDEGLTALLAERLSAGCPGGEAAASALLMGIPDFLADRKHAREFYQRLQAALGDELEEIFGAVVDAVPAADQRQALQLLHNQATTTEVGGEKGARPLPVADDGTAAGVDYPTLKGDTSPARQASPQRRSPQRKPDREPPHWAAAAGSTQWAAASLGRGRGAPVALDGADFPSLAGGRAAPAPSAAPTWGARGGGSAVRAPPPPQPTGGGGGGRAGSPDGRPAPAPAPAPAKAATEYCHACDGKGRVKGKKCDACNGAGEVTVVAEGPVRGAGPTLADFVGASTKRGKKKGGAAPAPAEQPEGAASGGAPREPRPRPQQRRAERPAQPAEEYPSLGSAAGAPARGAPPPRSGAWAAKAGAQAKPAAPPAAAHADPWATADAPPPRGGSPGRAAPEGSAKDAALAALAAAPPKMDSAADFPSLAAPQGGKKGKRQQQPAAVPGAAGAQAAGGRWVVPPKVRS